MIEDSRPIISAWGEDAQTGASVGMQGVTAIHAYTETGQMAEVPWLEVWKGDRLHARLNVACMTEIIYRESND